MKSLVFLLIPILIGCSTVGHRDVDSHVSFQEIVAETELTQFKSRGEGFFLKGAKHVANDDKVYVVIEGDGRAWVNKRTPSNDPTPRNPVGLNIARNLLPNNVVYLARPCQFLSQTDLAACSNRYWMLDRYSQPVLTIYNIILNRMSGKKVLIGYSGGGVIAARLAQQRNDIDTLVTIAAPLSLNEWTYHHKVTNMPLIDDPAKYNPLSKNIRQIHYFGEDDRVVPYNIAKPFLDKQPPHNIKVHQIADFDHTCCWGNKVYDF